MRQRITTLWLYLILIILPVLFIASQATNGQEHDQISVVDVPRFNAIARLVEETMAPLRYPAEFNALSFGDLLSGLGIEECSRVSIHNPSNGKNRSDPEYCIYFNGETYVGTSNHVDFDIATSDREFGLVLFNVSFDRASYVLNPNRTRRTKAVLTRLSRFESRDVSNQPILEALLRDGIRVKETKDTGAVSLGYAKRQSYSANLLSGSENRCQLIVPLEIECTPLQLALLQYQSEGFYLISRASVLSKQALDEFTYSIERDLTSSDLAEITLNQRLNFLSQVIVAYLITDVDRRVPPLNPNDVDFINSFHSNALADDPSLPLRKLGVNQVLFQFPCNYMIYSPLMDSLPLELRECICEHTLNQLCCRDEKSRYRPSYVKKKQQTLGILLMDRPAWFDGIHIVQAPGN